MTVLIFPFSDDDDDVFSHGCVSCGALVPSPQVHLCGGADPLCPECAHFDAVGPLECVECGEGID